MQSTNFNNVVPPIPVYKSVGNPYHHALSQFLSNTEAQNKLNTTHGGSKHKLKSRKKKRERKGGSKGTTTRPTEITIPQAPSIASPTGPNSGNHLATVGSQTLMDHFVNSTYDNLVVVPKVPQSGGSLLTRLERLTRRKKKGGKKNGKTRRHKNQKKKK